MSEHQAARGELYESAILGERGFHVIDESERRCRTCGCTDQLGCEEGCWWVEIDLCSECARRETGEGDQPFFDEDMPYGF